MNYKKKLIEVALPLDAINKESAREKSIRHGHPSTLHLWWARRPLAACRAVLFAQLVDDPSSHPDKFPTEEAQQRERERLFKIIEELVEWENINNEKVLDAARQEILNSSDGNPPPVLDPFCGGGSIPLEAQRLGLEAHASDLNPVAVLITKALIEIPPKFAGMAPVHPGSQSGKWTGAKGLAEDVRYYGEWMRNEAEKRIGHLYPKVKLPKEHGGGEATVIAWLWARTVKSPNPAFAQVDVPLASTFMLSTRAGKEAYIEPLIENGIYRFAVKMAKPKDVEAAKRGTKLARANFTCLMSGTPISGEYIKAEGKSGRMGKRLMAIVAEGNRGRDYLSPNDAMETVARLANPQWEPEGDVPARLTGGTCVPYGLERWGDLFTPRQLTALNTFSDLVQEAAERVKADYLGARASRPQKTVHSRGYLPHWEAGEVPQSITFRLSDSLPRELLESWRLELAKMPPAEQTLERRKRIETALDAGYGQCFLKRRDIAALVENALRHFDGSRYRLHAWVVMPNHVHVLATPLHGNSLSAIVHSWKSYTAKEANRILGETGAFWQEEYFDRAIRNEIHYGKVVEYIEWNPVKAGLCKEAADWEFGSACRGEDKRAGRPRSQDELPLQAGGSGAQAYADAVATYLAVAVDRLADYNSTICSWHIGRDTIRNTFARQAIPMTWDFAEANPFSSSTGNFLGAVQWVAEVVAVSPCEEKRAGRPRSQGRAVQHDAALPMNGIGSVVISTDPPYYDNIGYADLSDFFYVWLRRSLGTIYPELCSTMLVPKAQELIASPYRFNGSRIEAQQFFEKGLHQAFNQMYELADEQFPLTVYYAFKQAESQKEANGISSSVSTGWETMLQGLIGAGYAITGTWPMRTELANRTIAHTTNALASSIVLVCRRRSEDAQVTTRRDFINILKHELPIALKTLQRGNIAPVDLAQSAIGPGMAIFSRHSKVLEADGSAMQVRAALALINQVLDEFLAEQEGEYDADTRWALAWFELGGWVA